jgi:ribulose bisphosphate carboxylase small subunit
MDRKMTWEEMQQQFPNEWLRIIDFDVDESGHLVAGIVDRHSKQKDVVYRPPALQKPTAFRYTGESTFAGLRSHAQTHHAI